MNTLETARLILREFRESDLDDYAGICADAETMQYLGECRPLTRAEAWCSMALMLGHWRLRGYGLWAAEHKQAGCCIGRIGLWNPEGWPGLEIGWLIDRQFWGKGLAPEGAVAVLDFARTELGLDHIISVIRPNNRASIRVAEKIGQTFERRTIVGTHDVLIYGMRLKPH